MLALDPAYAQDEIEIEVNFDGAQVHEDEENDSIECTGTLSESFEYVHSLVNRTNDNEEASSHIATISDHIQTLEERIAALEAKETTRENEMQSLRLMYLSSVEENEALAAKIKKPEPSQANVHTSLQEFMEMDMKMHQMSKDKDRLISENERVATMCAQFQQEVLWKTLDLSENEKTIQRLQWTIDTLKTTLSDKSDEINTLRTKLSTLETQTTTLSHHKRLLVAEVKSLQKYSHINITDLIQDAQEARMVQKDLADKLAAVQAERDALKASLNAHVTLSSLN
ncbi:hypothetical protein THRCLA_06738 [Thraustotheca clavata]|uniref:Uncharacterized protein n=1 Tax=Thraustotheca clavata TaxID=74557 RepID=A0A1V9ZK45_9STRA|nr:hypothetical protein THRCLA_06738 [Thraustotheca clavata]